MGTSSNRQQRHEAHRFQVSLEGKGSINLSKITLRDEIVIVNLTHLVAQKKK
jgi:hypothetical protein